MLRLPLLLLLRPGEMFTVVMNGTNSYEAATSVNDGTSTASRRKSSAEMVRSSPGPAAVTVALRVLEREGFIKAGLRVIAIRNRKGLIKFTKGAYVRPDDL